MNKRKRHFRNKSRRVKRGGVVYNPHDFYNSSFDGTLKKPSLLQEIKNGVVLNPIVQNPTVEYQINKEVPLYNKSNLRSTGIKLVPGGGRKKHSRRKMKK